MKVVLLGAGGHARAVIAALRSSAAPLEAVACTDREAALHGRALDGVPVVGDDTALPGLLAAGATAACLGLGGVGDNAPRAALHRRAAQLGFVFPPVVHRDAHVASTATVGAGSVVLAGAVLGVGAELGEGVIVGNGAIVEHDCRAGDHAHLASGCVLGGGVHIGAGAHVGLGAVVLQGRSVGAHALVGAGAVVVHDVPDHTTVVGCPAAPLLDAANGVGAQDAAHA